MSFVGIAWSTIVDLAVLSEFMPHGDLHSYLRQADDDFTWEVNSKIPCSKLQIALDVAQALVYLHNFQPAIIHRDLKSRNILLDGKWQAKLSDFGISRVISIDETMTSNVGTIAWIAPEVKYKLLPH